MPIHLVQSTDGGTIRRLFIFFAAFFLIPGMTVIALIVHGFSLSLTRGQLWAFSFAISVGLFVVTYFRAPSAAQAFKYYLGASGILVTLFVLFNFGFKTEFTGRWLAEFFHAESRAASGNPAAMANDRPPGDLAGSSNDLEPATRHAGFNAPANSELSETQYTVVGLSRGDTLSVRSGPGTSHEIIDRLQERTDQIYILEPPVTNGSTEWVHIRVGSLTGWVTKQYLKAN